MKALTLILRLAPVCLLLTAGCFDDTPDPAGPAATGDARRISLEPVGVNCRYDSEAGTDVAESPLTREPQFILRSADESLKVSAGTVAIIFERFVDGGQILDPHWRLVFYDRFATRRVGIGSPFSLSVIQDGRELWTPNPNPGRGLTGHRFESGRYRATLSEIGRAHV